MKPWILFAGGLAVAGSAIAILAGNDLATALAGGTLAVSGAAAVGVLVFQDRVRRNPRSIAGPSGAPMIALARAFREGSLGRMTIIATIVKLEQRMPPEASQRIHPAEERRLMDSPNSEFRSWVRQRLSRLEMET